MSAFVMSDKYPKLCKAIENFGYDIIPSDKILQFNTPEQRHIDMQMLKINNDIFLLKECNNLITMDIVCHGVVSPLIWKENLKEISEKLGAKPINVNFRDKSFGWSTHIESYSCGNKLVTSGRYTAIFYENVFLRPCCYDCQYASVVRVSDITLADAWGIHRVSPDWDIEKGVSLVLLNTDMGREYFDRAKKDLVTKDVSIEEFMQPNLQHPSVRPKEREKAIRLYKNQGYVALADWCEKKYNYMVKKNKIKSEIVKIMRRLHLK